MFREKDLPLYLHEGRRHALRPCDTLEADGWITRERKDYFASLILDTLTGGPATREALRQTCRSKGLTDREEESVFQPWGGTIRALAEAGKIVHLVQEEKAFAWRLPLHRWGRRKPGGKYFAGILHTAALPVCGTQPTSWEQLRGS